MPNLDSNTRTSGSWDPDEPIFLMAQKFTACEYPYGGFQKNCWFIMENPIKIYDLGGTPISGNHHIILFPGFGCCWYQWRKVSALPVLVVEPIVRALDEDPPVHHVEVSKKMEVPQNHAKLVVINAKTQWFVVPIFSGTPLKWRDPIIRLGYDEDWIWLSKCGDPKLMFSLCSPFPTQRVTAFWSVRVQLRPGIRVFLKIYPLIQYGSR